MPDDFSPRRYGKNGPQNYSFWDNKEFQALSEQIDREIDPVAFDRTAYAVTKGEITKFNSSPRIEGQAASAPVRC